MQLKLGEDPLEKKRELERKRFEEERLRKERIEKEKYFRENFKYGSTTVLKHKGQFFFCGDIAHSGAANIFHNARKIKSFIKQNSMTKGHMSYNDPPTFDTDWKWEKEEHERKTIYKDDLYKFDGDKIIVAELIGDEPIGHIYKNSSPNDDYDESEEDENSGSC